MIKLKHFWILGLFMILSSCTPDEYSDFVTKIEHEPSWTEPADVTAHSEAIKHNIPFVYESVEYSDAQSKRYDSMWYMYTDKGHKISIGENNFNLIADYFGTPKKIVIEQKAYKSKKESYIVYQNLDPRKQLFLELKRGFFGKLFILRTVPIELYSFPFLEIQQSYYERVNF